MILAAAKSGAFDERVLQEFSRWCSSGSVPASAGQQLLGVALASCKAYTAAGSAAGEKCWPFAALAAFELLPLTFAPARSESNVAALRPHRLMIGSLWKGRSAFGGGSRAFLERLLALPPENTGWTSLRAILSVLRSPTAPPALVTAAQRQAAQLASVAGSLSDVS